MGGLDAHWWWLLFAAVLGIAEMVIPGVFLIWMAAAAALTGLLVYAFDLPFAFQLASFALLSVGAVAVTRRIYQRGPHRSEDPLLNNRAGRLIGQQVEVVTAISGGEGRVRVGDGVWIANGPDVPAGARVRVVGGDGACLRVEPIEALPPATQH